MIRNILIIAVSFFILTGCFQEEKKVEKKRKPVENMAQKVVKKVTKEKPLSKIVEEDGIVVDGARDEKLLDAFGLAVSQVMINDGVSVPDCEALSKTGFLTKEECTEITDKYTGFYEVTEDGELIKVDNIFDEGIKGKGVELGEGVEFFDSSGNPLLENEIEFNEYVANSDDIEALKKLKAKIPKEKIEMLKNVEQKLEFLESIESVQKQTEKEQKAKNEQEQELNRDFSSGSQSSGGSGSGTSNYENEKKLAEARRRLEKAEAALALSPNNQALINEYNQALADVNYYESLVNR